jgi:hypothetical protein
MVLLLVLPPSQPLLLLLLLSSPSSYPAVLKLLQFPLPQLTLLLPPPPTHTRAYLIHVHDAPVCLSKQTWLEHSLALLQHAAAAAAAAAATMATSATRCLPMAW